MITGGWAVIIAGKHVLTKKIHGNQGENYTPSGHIIPLMSFKVVGDRFVYSETSYDVIELMDSNTYKGEYYLAGTKLFYFTLKRIHLSEDGKPFYLDENNQEVKV